MDKLINYKQLIENERQILMAHVKQYGLSRGLGVEELKKTIGLMFSDNSLTDEDRLSLIKSYVEMLKNFK